MSQEAYDFIADITSPNPSSSPQSTKVLDLGCGEGRLMDHLAVQGADVYGVELERFRDAYELLLKGRLGDDYTSRVRFSDNDAIIPFDGGLFDWVVSTSVLEHVRDHHAFFKETARVLSSGGRAVMTFPYGSAFIEPHNKIPFCHWMPDGRVRRFYLWAWYYVVKRRGSEASAVALSDSGFLNSSVAYRSKRQVWDVASLYFDEVKSIRYEFEQSRAKRGQRGGAKRWLRRIIGQNQLGCRALARFSSEVLMVGQPRSIGGESN